MDEKLTHTQLDEKLTALFSQMKEMVQIQEKIMVQNDSISNEITGIKIQFNDFKKEIYQKYKSIESRVEEIEKNQTEIEKSQSFMAVIYEHNKKRMDTLMNKHTELLKENEDLNRVVRDITKLRGYPRSNVKTRLEQSNLFLASGIFPLQNAIYDNKLPFSRM